MEPRKPSFITYLGGIRPQRPSDTETERYPEHPEREPEPKWPERPNPYETQAIPEHPEREPRPKGPRPDFNDTPR